MEISIPRGNTYNIKYLVFDYNGTIAEDGTIEEGFLERVGSLDGLGIHVITADTYGTVRRELEGTSVTVEIISRENGSRDKLRLIEKLGPEMVMAFGNGSNDRLMLESAAIGVAVLGAEGLSTKALKAADIVVRSLDDALRLVEDPQRLIADLRE